MKTQGDKFPKFNLEGCQNDLKLVFTENDLKGKWSFIFFYPEDFSFICPTEAIAFEKERKKIEDMGGQIIGISVDDVDTHLAWASELDLKYTLLSDTGFDLCKNLGILDPDKRAKRATFIISPDLIIEFLMVSSRNVGRSVNETMRIFDAIQTGRMCPVDFVK